MSEQRTKLAPSEFIAGFGIVISVVAASGFIFMNPTTTGWTPWVAFYGALAGLMLGRGILAQRRKKDQINLTEGVATFFIWLIAATVVIFIAPMVAAVGYVIFLAFGVAMVVCLGLLRID